MIRLFRSRQYQVWPLTQFSSVCISRKIIKMAPISGRALFLFLPVAPSSSNYSIIGVTLNTKLDTLWLSQVGGPMEGLTEKYDTSPESWVPGAKPGVGFMLIASILCLPSQFENCTFCRAEYSEILPFDKKLACLANYQERRRFPWPLVNI